MLKFFNSGSVFANFTGAELLSSPSIIAGLVRRAAGMPALESLFKPMPAVPSSPQSPDKAAGTRQVVAQPVVKDVKKTIWTWWNDGEESLSPFLKACVASWRSRHPDWDVVVLGLKNLHKYVPDEDLPDTFHSIDRKSLQSDLVRVALLARHGGCYVDMSSLAQSDFAEDAWRRLHSGASFVGFKAPHFISDFVSAWCMAVLPNNPVLVAWNRVLKEALPIA